jgi:signal transduction histidine kinase
MHLLAPWWENLMRAQDLTHLDAAIEALTVCTDVDMLFATLLARLRDVFHMEAAFVWLTADGEASRLSHAEGVSTPVAARLQRLKISASGDRTVARRLHRLGYRAVLAAPLCTQGKTLGMVATGSQHSRRPSRIEAAMFHLLVRNAASALKQWQSPPALADEGARRPVTAVSDLNIWHERTHLLHTFVSGMTHDLNNAMTAIGGRVDLLLHRVRDQVVLQHLTAAQHAILEASQLIRHIHGFISGDQGGGAVMIDMNQLVQDSVRIARAPWFQGFRQRHVPVEVGADLQPVPALPGNASDLRIALLCLLRHGMDTLRPGGELMVHTSSIGEAAGQRVLVSLADGPAHPCSAEHEDGIGMLMRQAHTPESRLALELVQRIVYDQHGQIAVNRGTAGETATTLSFPVNKTAVGEGSC